MTTHDQHTDVYDNQGSDPSREFAGNPNHVPEDQVAPMRNEGAATQNPGPPTAPMDPNLATGVQQQDQRGQHEQSDLSSHSGHGTPSAHESHSGHENDSDAGLFAHDELAGLRARWDAVQASFVDDPKDCVQKADGLVADLVQQLTTGFDHARSRLEDQWSRGEQASTEDLRVALKRYRSFFERLLSV
ncbi:MAG: hypothetical protein PGN37_11505 [Mycobacterium kyogaense]|uniref:hypothetical protein n=1 Tax=Mycobacterium kyogaense TaxID=2212479 RepID=UPI002FFA3E0B